MHLKTRNLVFFYIVAFSLVTFQSSIGFQLPGGKNYGRLTNALCAAATPNDFIAFTDFIHGYDRRVHSASMKYFNTHPELVDRIRNDLESENVRWQVTHSRHRVLFVPEEREDVVTLFTHYCQDVIQDLLEETGLLNPFESISAVDATTSFPPADLGIRAYIVQDITEEFLACYQFSGATPQRIEINLSGKIPVNEVGSYSSYLQYSETTNQWEFIRNNYTFWKSMSKNPYTVLMTPLEETLHIALRQHTETAILNDVNGKGNPLSSEEVRNVVDNWIAVEEAIVGGIVYRLAPDILLKRIPELPAEWIHMDLKTKSGFEKYHLLEKGIKIVDAEGVKESIFSYSQNPNIFRMRLLENEPGIKKEPMR